MNAEDILHAAFVEDTKLDGLPTAVRPTSRADAYRVQAALIDRFGAARVGWKIAATSVAGQRHIGVDGPLAGALRADRVLESGASVPLGANVMRVAEAEFAFRFARDLPPRDGPWSIEEVLGAVDSMMPTIEVPDSRYKDFVRVGAESLIADTACSCWLFIGAPAPESWRDTDLRQHHIVARVNGEVRGEGTGAAVLGDPREALAWLVNEVATHCGGVRAGEFVTTGTCVVPVAIAEGDHIRAEFGAFGSVEARVS